MSSSAEQFANFDFDNNEDWKRYSVNLNFPPGVNEQTAIIKFKHKWYKRHIDPEFEIPTESPAQSSPPKEDRPAPAPKIVDLDDEFPSEPVPSTIPHPEPVPQPRSQARPQPAPQATNKNEQAPSRFATIAHSVIKSGNIMTLIFAVLAIFGSVALFKMAMVSSLINNALSLVLQMPKLSLAWYRTVSSNDNMQYIYFNIIFLLSSSAMPLALMPIAIFAFYHSALILKQFVLKVPIAFVQNLSVKIDSALANQTQAAMLVSMLEIFIMVNLLISVITGSGNVFQLFLYWQFLNNRYINSANLRWVTQMLEQRIDQFTSGYGILFAVWTKVKAAISFLSTARRQREREAAAQQQQQQQQ